MLGFSVASRCAGLGIEKTSSAAARHQHGGDAIGGLGREAVEQAAGDRPDDGRRLPGGGVPGDRVGEVFLGHEVGDQRCRGRSEEGAGDAEDGKHGEDRPDAGQAAQREEQQRQRAQRLDAGRRRP